MTLDALDLLGPLFVQPSADCHHRLIDVVEACLLGGELHHLSRRYFDVFG